LSESILKDLPGFDLLSFSPTSIVGIILLIMLIAFLAGTLPAKKAAKQNPIDALRYE
jgi:putative ABC transport system permease protein